ncbi:MAG: Nif3-like dinuclear metal center hexameric protein [Candidatus Thorarchaeota archaeon]|nr:Nif3-like dinuclear metal center hexameric protein [Candidatus Thorarchaeota archaeon]
MVTLFDIVQYLEDIAPNRLAFAKRKSYVEIGPQSTSDQIKTTVNRVLVASYPSARVVTSATQQKANLLISNRPIFAAPKKHLSGWDLDRVRLLSKNYISTYVMSSAWTGAENGLSDALVERLGLTHKQQFMTKGEHESLVPAGRIVKTTEPMNHSRFLNYVADKMNLSSIKFTGQLDQEVEKVLVFPGSLISKNEILSALEKEARTIVTGDATPQTRIIANERGCNLLELGSLSTENPGMERLNNYLNLEFPELKVFYVEAKPYSRTFCFDRDM